MTSESARQPDKWHRIGVILTLVGLVLSLVALVLINYNMPRMWQESTRHSDRPAQVEDAALHIEKEIAELQERIDARVAELQFVAARAERKADESRRGIGESGGPEPANATALAALAPQWDRTAATVHAILERRATANSPLMAPMPSSTSAAAAPADSLAANTTPVAPASAAHVAPAASAGH